MSEELLWHYTTFDIYKRILKQGAITPDRTEPANEKEIPTVTFSAHQQWEPTRYRIGRFPTGQHIMMNQTMLDQFCGGLIRIGVKPELAPMDWHMMRDGVGLSKGARKAIYDFAVSVGARTKHWYGTFQPVPEQEWSAVQKFKDGQWIDISGEERPNLDDVNLDEPAGIFEIKFEKLDKPGQVDVSSTHEQTEAIVASSMEAAAVDGQTERQ